jgi:hypothetical protein
MTHHLGSAAAFREALYRAIAVGVLLVVGALIAVGPTQCAASASEPPPHRHAAPRAPSEPSAPEGYASRD